MPGDPPRSHCNTARQYDDRSPLGCRIDRLTYADSGGLRERGARTSDRTHPPRPVGDHSATRFAAGGARRTASRGTQREGLLEGHSRRPGVLPRRAGPEELAVAAARSYGSKGWGFEFLPAHATSLVTCLSARKPGLRRIGFAAPCGGRVSVESDALRSGTRASPRTGVAPARHRELVRGYATAASWAQASPGGRTQVDPGDGRHRPTRSLADQFVHVSVAPDREPRCSTGLCAGLGMSTPLGAIRGATPGDRGRLRRAGRVPMAPRIRCAVASARRRQHDAEPRPAGEGRAGGREAY